jgi:hypothetical protein
MPGLVRRSGGHRKVRICERLGVQFPGPTRPQQTVNPAAGTSAYWRAVRQGMGKRAAPPVSI